MADVLEPAVHRSIVLVDVEGFGARRRTRADQGEIRHGMYQALRLAFSRARISWDDCYHEDRGDGVLILVPAQVPKAVLAAGILGGLAAAVHAHNQVHQPNAQMRLRLALHGGEVAHDAYGVTGTAVTVAFRLLEAAPLKQALAGSPGVLAAITSAWFYEEVIRHTEACAPATWRRVLVTVKETREEGWISLPDAPYPAQPDAALPLLQVSGTEVRYSLPPDTAAFTGRGAELDRITAAVAVTASGVVTVGAIDGMPGVGKTALAVHVAHELSGRFPDRQLFINLHAHTPGREPVAPEDALAGLLAAAGVDPRFVPDDLDGLAAMWRDRMATQRALLVLDNAASSAQVTPLLPGGGECLVLVTSRRHLGDLPGAVVPVLLDVLPAERAEEMFIRLAPRAIADRAGVAEVVRLAGFLPLAVSLLARVYARHQSWTLADLAAQTRESLLTLAAEHESIAAAFEVSYQHLGSVQQRFLRRLGLLPGTTVDAWAAAALAGMSVQQAAGHLNTLQGEGLLTEVAFHRYGMHDLIRRYAHDRASADSAATRKRALARLLDYYQYTAAAAGTHLGHPTRACSVQVAPPSVTVELPDSVHALAWARAERANLLACLDQVTETGQRARIVGLTAGLAALLRHDGPWADAIIRHTTAAQAAQHLGDRLGQAGALNDLGVVRRLTGDYPGAVQALEEALGISRDLGDRLGQASALNHLGTVRRMTGDYPAAVRAFEGALGMSRDLGDRLGQASALGGLGAVRWMTGDYPAAAQALEEALGISRDLDDRLGQANVLSNLGAVRWMTGDYPAAAQAQEEALGISRDLGDRRGQANALNHLGTVRRMTGDYPGAARAHQEALEIYRDLGDRRGQAAALNPLGTVRQLTGDYPGAIRALEEALGISRDVGDRLGQSIALNNLGVVRRLTGDYAGAAQAHQEVLRTYRDIGDRGGEVEVLNNIGTLHRVRGDLGLSEATHRQALELAREIGSSWDEAHALAGLGRCALAVGNRTDGESGLRQALEIFRQTGAAEAAGISAEIDVLTSAGPATPGS